MLGEGWTYRIVLALSGISLILVIVYLVQIEQNRSLRADVEQRQQFINQSIQLGRVNDALIRALAHAAVADNDDKLRQLLAQNGITIDPKTGAPIAGGAIGGTPAAGSESGGKPAAGGAAPAGAAK